MDVVDLDLTLLRLLDYTLLALALWGFVDAATRKPEAFPAANRLTKPIWLGILAASAFVAFFLSAFSLFGMAAAVATIVYLGDVRPAVRELRSGGW
jgi:hypothetical protein